MEGVKSMNDIEVLEHIALAYKNDEQLNGLVNIKTCRLMTNGELAQAIENLLKERQSDKERIKDLEEINEAHKKENGELRERVNKQALLKEKIIALLKGE